MQQNTPKRILIADDEPDILEFLQVILEEEGYAVITSEGSLHPKNHLGRVMRQQA